MQVTSAPVFESTAPEIDTAAAAAEEAGGCITCPGNPFGILYLV
jgi:predicted enzyme related to lactoylglutathione lyase